MAIGLSVLPDGLGDAPPLIQFGFPTRFNGLSVSGISVLMRIVRSVSGQRQRVRTMALFLRLVTA